MNDQTDRAIMALNMFTGIIQALGKVESVGTQVLHVQPGEGFSHENLGVGESIAVNGVCLTLLESAGGSTLTFDVSPETFARTTLADLKPGSVVNMERAMSAGSLFGGHIVQGHVDTTGRLLRGWDEEQFRVYRFAAPPEYDRYLIDKGSVAVDGVSLTVVRPEAGEFDVWLVPHTLSHTDLGTLEVGSRVNLEFDVLAKHVEKLLQAGVGAPGAHRQGG